MTKEEIKNIQHNILDHGFIKVVDIMGDDARVVSSARVSYGDGTKTVNEDKGLINYLMKHHHTSPMEQCVITLHCKLPLFVFAQWVRHRIWKFNVQSYRYSKVEEEFYKPEKWRGQSNVNKQCSNGNIDDEQNTRVKELYDKNIDNAFADYEALIQGGVSREMARMLIPQSVYTEFYATIDLHNLLHFIKLRNHHHAQYEIRVYAEKLAEIVKAWCPMVYEAFVEHRLNAVILSGKQKNAIQSLIKSLSTFQEDKTNQEFDVANHTSMQKLSNRELQEIVKMLK